MGVRGQGGCGMGDDGMVYITDNRGIRRGMGHG